jgi:hypothetical protein
LINRSVPLIAIQLNAWEVGGVMTLTATKVMDLLPVAPDDEEDAPGQGVDRAFWVARSKPESLQLADDLLALIHQATGDASLALKYNKANMGLARNGIPDNFVSIYTRKTSGHIVVECRLPQSEELSARMEEAGLDVMRYDKGFRCYVFRVNPNDLVENRELLSDLLQRASGLKPPAPDPDLAPALAAGAREFQ